MSDSNQTLLIVVVVILGFLIACLTFTFKLDSLRLEKGLRKCPVVFYENGPAQEAWLSDCGDVGRLGALEADEDAQGATE